jgi:hypothetical protein
MSKAAWSGIIPKASREDKIDKSRLVWHLLSSLHPGTLAEQSYRTIRRMKAAFPKLYPTASK